MVSRLIISFVSLVSLGHNSRLVSRWPTRPWISCAVRGSPLLAVDRVWQGHGISPIKHVTSAFRGKVFAVRGCTGPNSGSERCSCPGSDFSADRERVMPDPYEVRKCQKYVLPPDPN